MKPEQAKNENGMGLRAYPHSEESALMCDASQRAIEQSRKLLNALSQLTTARRGVSE